MREISLNLSDMVFLEGFQTMKELQNFKLTSLLRLSGHSRWLSLNLFFGIWSGLQLEQRIEHHPSQRLSVGVFESVQH